MKIEMYIMEIKKWLPLNSNYWDNYTVAQALLAQAKNIWFERNHEGNLHNFFLEVLSFESRNEIQLCKADGEGLQVVNF